MRRKATERWGIIPEIGFKDIDIAKLKDSGYSFIQLLEQAKARGYLAYLLGCAIDKCEFENARLKLFWQIGWETAEAQSSLTRGDNLWDTMMDLI